MRLRIQIRIAAPAGATVAARVPALSVPLIAARA